MSREQTITQKVKTEFGAMYVHIDYDIDHKVKGGWISWGTKDPESKIVGLISSLSEGLNSALKNVD